MKNFDDTITFEGIDLSETPILYITGFQDGSILTYNTVEDFFSNTSNTDIK